ncbi:MAG TPA: sugar kinase [Anaerovoracaceae bacterium]|nr:sugar kinase [Anaerovoracaceae bacterium]
MEKLVCFGEIMCRFSPPGYLKIVQTDEFQISFAGGEANVAVAVSNFGGDAKFVTKLPDNDLAKSAMRVLRGYGVDVSGIAIGGDRMGVYYVEKGASQRPSKVIYDRKYSSLAMAGPEEFDWDAIFEGAAWFHFTGITPALSDNLATICKEACQAARKKNITVSCDLNYRKNLWSSEKAGQVMSGLMEYVDVCIANEEDAEKVFGIKAEDTDLVGGTLSKQGYRKVAQLLMERFDFSKVAITLRGSISASDNTWAGILYDGKELYASREYKIHLVDRVGGGDSFGGGLIYALMGGYEPQQAIEFAVAASCLKQATEFDFSQATVQEVRSLMDGDGSGRVQR